MRARAKSGLGFLLALVLIVLGTWLFESMSEIGVTAQGPINSRDVLGESTDAGLLGTLNKSIPLPELKILLGDLGSVALVLGMFCLGYSLTGWLPRHRQHPEANGGSDSIRPTQQR